MALAVIIVSAMIVVALIGQIGVRRFTTKEVLDNHQSMVEAMLGVVGTLFSVLLGLLVAGAIDNYRDVRLQVNAEANGLADVFRLARGLSDVDRPRIRQLCREYGEVVLTDEWPRMKKQEMSPQAWEGYQKLWEAVIAVDPTENRQNNIHQTMLAAMEGIGENRRARAVACESSLTPVLWIAIISGSLITIGFTHFFSSKFGTLHFLMTGLVAISLGLNIWLLAAYSSPFTGELQIKPAMFQLIKHDAFSQPDTPSRFWKSMQK